MTEKHHEEANTQQAANFANQFLIAMPGMVEGSLAGSVIYVCEHSERGALGLVINRPTDLTLGTLFERIDLTLEIGPVKDTLVFFGGPVQTDRGFVLHAPAGGMGKSRNMGKALRQRPGTGNRTPMLSRRAGFVARADALVPGPAGRHGRPWAAPARVAWANTSL